ncbi:MULTISPECIES: hypothetical protein [unclassified Flavobacterium]|uniref:hypothetical protein n=1 Tax=unclassified Flavobacterium TaxID=196869 RepID=UPI001AC3B1E8|nr:MULTISPECIES: hypothetical protein [unclassified Flavobacterium]MBN9285331.1 hypothetical protein [Flavobacterium sp.]
MSRKKYDVILRLFQIMPAVALLHILIFQFGIPSQTYQAFHYPVYTVYLFFFILSLVLLFILIKINETKPEQLGFVFLVLISIKFALSYIFLLPVLQDNTESTYMEKINFFMIFIAFLAVEVVLASRLLNKK